VKDCNALEWRARILVIESCTVGRFGLLSETAGALHGSDMRMRGREMSMPESKLRIRHRT